MSFVDFRCKQTTGCAGCVDKNVGINGFRYRRQCGMDNKRNMYMPEYSTVQ